MFHSRLFAGALLAVILALCALFGWGYYQRNRAEKAEATLIEQQAELEGAKKALLVAPKEVVKFVEVPVAIARAVKSGMLTPVAAGKFEVTSDVVSIPCPPPVRLDDESVSKGLAPVADKPAQVDIVFGLTGEFFIGKIKHGAVEYTSTFKATVRSVDDSWHSDVPISEENVAFTVKVNEDIAKAVDAYNQPWAKKHLKFMCPGIGVTYNPLDTVRPVNVGISCSYGFVW